MEPFLIVGLIASIRRVLVITTQAAQLAEQGGSQAGGSPSGSFQSAMIELAVVGFLILVFVFAIYLLRRAAHKKDVKEQIVGSSA